MSSDITEEVVNTASPQTDSLRKILFIGWLASSALLAWLLGYVTLHGSTPDRTNLAGDLGLVWGGTGGSLAWQVWKARKQVSAHYALFILSLVCFTAVAASGIFLLVSATTQGTPDAFAPNSISIIGIISTVIWVSRSWASITKSEPETDPVFRKKHRAVSVKAGAVIAVVLVSLGVYGYYSGIRAAHKAKIEMLTEEMENLGRKTAPTKQLVLELTTERTQNLPEYLQRCTQLEAAINDYEPALRQMDNLLSQTQREVNEVKDVRFASFLPVATTLRAVLGKDIESSEAHRKEIAYAKQLSGLAGSERLTFYTANIQPVIDEEYRIAKDEIEILKDAKQRGVALPDNLSKEAGVN